MQNLRIRTKITCIISALLFLFLALGLFAIERMSKLNEKTVEITENWLPTIDSAARVRYFLASIRISHAAFIISNSADDLKDQEAVLKPRKDGLFESMKEYKSNISNAEEATLFEKFSSQLNQYLEDETRLIAVAKQSILTTTEDSAKELDAQARNEFTTSRKVFNNALDTITALIRLDRESAEAAKQQAEQIYTQAMLLIGLAIVLAMVIAFAGGTLLVRNIATPVTRLTTNMQQLAQNDTSQQVPGTERRDEIGLMAQTVLVFKSNMIEADRLRAQQQAEQQRQLDRAKQIEVLEPRAKSKNLRIPKSGEV